PLTDDEDPIPPQPSEDEEILVGPEPPDINIPPGGDEPRKYYIHGDEVSIIAERIEHLDEYGKLVTETLRDYSKKTLRNRYASLDAFLMRWNSTARKQAIIEELESEGLLLEPLADEVGKDLDPFDL